VRADFLLFKHGAGGGGKGLKNADYATTVVMQDGQMSPVLCSEAAISVASSSLLIRHETSVVYCLIIVDKTFP
jgi:hypothetical protein